MCRKRVFVWLRLCRALPWCLRERNKNRTLRWGRPGFAACLSFSFGEMRKLALILLSIQVFGVALVVFGDIGFDKPGKLGLDYNALLFVVAMELGLFLTLMAVSVLNKK